MFCISSSKLLSVRCFALSLWLLAAMVLAQVGSASPSAAANACGAVCAQKIAAGWTPVVVEIREKGKQLEAISYAERVKRHLGYKFAKRKEQFVRAQLRIESHRRAHRRHAKARQFAEARRRVAQHVHKLLPGSGGHLRRFVHKHTLAQRAAHNNAPNQPQAN
jgi:hypothetical protein